MSWCLDEPFWFSVASIAGIAGIVGIVGIVGIMWGVMVLWSWGDYMDFSREMNAVASALGWPDPAETDLFKTTREARKAGKPELPMGVYYF